MADDCVTKFSDLKLRKKFKYIVFNLNKALTEIVVLKASNEADYDKFLEELPKDECRWAVYDFEFQKEGEGQRNKLFFISWSVASTRCNCLSSSKGCHGNRSPDDAKVKAKMVFAASREALKRKLDGIALEIQGTAFDEVDYKTGLSTSRLWRYVLIPICCSSG